MKVKVCEKCKSKLLGSEVILCAACEYDKECETGADIIE
jgi:hypothetical protein